MAFRASCEDCGPFVDANLRGNTDALETEVGQHAVANPGHKVWVEPRNAEGEL
jgi:hypothetical protein